MDTIDNAPVPAAPEWADFLSAALEVWRIDRDNLEGLPPGEGGPETPTAGKPIDGARLAAMLRSVGLDPDRVPNAFPDLMRRAEDSCHHCREQARCDDELAAGTAETNLSEFCPNAARIRALVAALAAGESQRER